MADASRVEVGELREFFLQNGWSLTARAIIESDPSRGETRLASFQEGDLAVSELDQVAVYGTPGIFVTGKKEILAESAIYPALEIRFRNSSELAVDFSLDPKPGSYLFLDGIYSEFFWHWVMEYLPRIVMTRKTSFKGSYVIRESAPSFVRGSLEILRIPPEQILTRGSETWVVETLVVPEMLTGTSGHGRVSIPEYRSLLRQLRAFMLRGHQDPAERNKKIYIARQNAARGRNVRNEPEVVQLVRKFGFEIIAFEKLNLDEQISFVSQASVLCGAHGAGMVHSLFMQEVGTVVELFSPNFVTDTNQAIIELLGHAYFAVNGLPSDEDQHVEPNLQNITVDLEKLEKVLSEQFEKP